MALAGVGGDLGCLEHRSSHHQRDERTGSPDACSMGTKRAPPLKKRKEGFDRVTPQNLKCWRVPSFHDDLLILFYSLFLFLGDKCGCIFNWIDHPDPAGSKKLLHIITPEEKKKGITVVFSAECIQYIFNFLGYPQSRRK